VDEFSSDIVPAVPLRGKRVPYSRFAPATSSNEWLLSDYTRTCSGEGDASSQNAWHQSIASAEQNTSLLAYLRSVYGPTLSSVPRGALSELRFFWDTVPGRDTVNVTWLSARCAILGLERPQMLYAPIDDVQHSLSLLTRPMVERCAAARCSDLDRCWDVRLRPLRADDRAVTRVEARRIAGSGMRRCLASSLEAFGNFSSAPTFSTGVASGFTQNATFTVGSAGYPHLDYRFPGFFVRLDGTALVSTTADGNRQARGVNNFTWVEVMRIDRIDDKRPDEHADRATVGQLWFWHAPGSGVWWNTGRTLVLDLTQHIRVSKAGAFTERACASPFSIFDWWRKRDEVYKHQTCTAVRDKGYDSMQLLSSFCGFSHEFVDCRGAGRGDANTTWSIACPPPHVPLMRGLPEPRHAPALTSLPSLHGVASRCHCSVQLDHINCAGNAKPLSAVATSSRLSYTPANRSAAAREHAMASPA